MLFLLFGSVYTSAVTDLALSYDKSLRCHQCIRSGFIFNVPTETQDRTSLIATGGAYSGECCENMSDTTNCGNSIASTDTLSDGWATVNPVGGDRDLAVSKCPTKADLCGGVKEVMLHSDEQVMMSGAWTAADQCTWLVRAECRAPAFTIGVGDPLVDVTDAEVEIFYIEYSASQVNLSGNWTDDKKEDENFQTCGVPDYTASDTENLAGQLPFFK